MYILLNAFSLNMLAVALVTVTIKEITAGDAADILLTEADARGTEPSSAVGHADTATVFSDILGFYVPCNRETITLSPGDVAIIGQYSGPRLPDGATSLPEGAAIRWFRVDV